MPNNNDSANSNNPEEKNLKRNFLFAKNKGAKAGMEGEGMGGQKFGENNLTPSGDDKNNPSQNAGNTNAYFNITEPAEEHPENSNFKLPEQEGEPDYSRAQSSSATPYNEPGQQKTDENSKAAEPQQPYSEDTADDN